MIYELDIFHSCKHKVSPELHGRQGVNSGLSQCINEQQFFPAVYETCMFDRSPFGIPLRQIDCTAVGLETDTAIVVNEDV